MFSALSRSRFYDPDDTGGQGDPDPDAPVVETPAPPTPAADLKAVADSIKAAILEARAPVAAAPTPVQTGPSEATRRALEEESGQVNARFNELVNSGQAAEAMALRDQFIQKANRALAPAQDDNNTLVRTAVAVGERLAKSEHKDVMSRWGDEVRRTVEAMPVDERVNPDAWDRAVGRVKTAHFDELLNEQVNSRVTEAKKAFAPPPVMPGARGSRTLTGAAAKLSEEQVWGADLCGVEPTEYAKELARETAYDALPFKERGPFPGYPILGDKVTPGGF